MIEDRERAVAYIVGRLTSKSTAGLIRDEEARAFVLMSGNVSADLVHVYGRGDALAALAERPWAMEPEGTAARQWAVALCRDAGFEPDIRFESADVLFHRRLVRAGLAAAFLPDLLRKDEIQQGLSTEGQIVGARRIFTAVRQGASTHPATLACRNALGTAAGAPSSTNIPQGSIRNI